MFKHITRFGCAILVLLAVVVRLAAASEVSVTFRDGKVTVVARDATLRQVLAEWQRVGHTRIEPLDRVPAQPITIELVDVPQSQALAMILRSLSGYIAARRSGMLPGGSLYDRILLTPTLAQASTTVSTTVVSSTPPRPAQTVPDFMRNGMPGAFPGSIPGGLGADDSDASSGDDVQDDAQQPLVRPGLPLNRRPGGMPVTGMIGMPMPDPSGQPIDPYRQGSPAPSPVKGPVTVPMPGMLIPGPSATPKGPGGIPSTPPRPPGDPRS